MELGGKLVVETCYLILAGNYPTKSQEELSKSFKALLPAPKIFKDTCLINWNQSTDKIHNHIRGLSPYPAAWFKIKQGEKEFNVKVYSSSKEHSSVEKMGEIVTDNKTFIKISTLDGYIFIKELQLSGKKRMKVEDLLRGFDVENFTIT
jgi:methionyl-tRNA formyltransferase